MSNSHTPKNQQRGYPGHDAQLTALGVDEAKRKSEWYMSKIARCAYIVSSGYKGAYPREGVYWEREYLVAKAVFNRCLERVESGLRPDPNESRRGSLDLVEARNIRSVMIELHTAADRVRRSAQAIDSTPGRRAHSKTLSTKILIEAKDLILRLEEVAGDLETPNYLDEKGSWWAKIKKWVDTGW